MMNVHFWGTRGSIPRATSHLEVREKIINALAQANGRQFADKQAIDAFLDKELSFARRGSFGGNTSCVEVDCLDPGSALFCDAGSGLREAGVQLLRRRGRDLKTVHILISHMHWDHIMGLQFMPQVYMRGMQIVIHGCHDNLEAGIRRSFGNPLFPVDFNMLPSELSFVWHPVDEPFQIGSAEVTTMLQCHGGDSFGYRIRNEGRSLVYATDSEHKLSDQEELQRVVQFMTDADLVVFDAMYSLGEAITQKLDWGHSSNMVGVDLCLNAHVKRLALFHHDPAYSDLEIEQVLQDSVRYADLIRPQGHKLQVLSAYDGLEVAL